MKYIVWGNGNIESWNMFFLAYKLCYDAVCTYGFFERELASFLGQWVRNGKKETFLFLPFFSQCQQMSGELPDPTFCDFKGSTFVDRRVLCSSKLSMDRLRGYKMMKLWVGRVAFLNEWPVPLQLFECVANEASLNR